MKLYVSILAAFLLPISIGASAQKNLEPEWILLSSDPDTSYFIDKSALKRNGEIVTGWDSVVLNKRKISVKNLREYNCKTKQQRTLSGFIFAKMDFTGNTIPVPKTDWEYVVRGSFGEDVLDYVCKEAPKQSWIDRMMSKLRD